MSSKRHIRRSACLGKHRYDTAAAAREAMAGLHRRKGFQGHMQAYHCEFCGGFHFGHPAQPKRPRGRYR